MNEALNYLWYIGEHFLEGFLEEAEILPGVTIGYILIATIIMGMLIGTLTTVPNNINFNIQRGKDAQAAREKATAEREARGAERRSRRRY